MARAQGVLIVNGYVGAPAAPATPAPDASTPQSIWKGNPQIIDISPFCNVKVPLAKSNTGALSSRVVVDGVPFLVTDLIRLYGQTADEHNNKFPGSAKGIPIGRRFDELQLIHYAGWPDVDGEAIAYVCLNYDDDTEAIIPIRYGVHVRDHINLPSYELEAVSDPGTTVCWRAARRGSTKPPPRLFKSKLANPSPDQLVKTIDFVSARHLSSYCLCAATVINYDDKGKEPHDGERPFVGDRKYDSKLVIQVFDDDTRKQIEGALVEPGLDVTEEFVVGSPFYTSSAGEGVIPFPKADTRSMYVTVTKSGYNQDRHDWQQAEAGTFTFRLVRSNSAATASAESPPASNEKAAQP